MHIVLESFCLSVIAVAGGSMLAAFLLGLYRDFSDWKKGKAHDSKSEN